MKKIHLLLSFLTIILCLTSKTVAEPAFETSIYSTGGTGINTFGITDTYYTAGIGYGSNASGSYHADIYSALISLKKPLQDNLSLGVGTLCISTTSAGRSDFEYIILLGLNYSLTKNLTLKAYAAPYASITTSYGPGFESTYSTVLQNNVLGISYVF